MSGRGSRSLSEQLVVSPNPLPLLFVARLWIQLGIKVADGASVRGQDLRQVQQRNLGVGGRVDSVGRMARFGLVLGWVWRGRA